MFTWKVELNQNGRTMVMLIEASSQTEALEFAGARAPGYYPSSAQRA